MTQLVKPWDTTRKGPSKTDLIGTPGFSSLSSVPHRSTVASVLRQKVWCVCCAVVFTAA